MRYVLTATSPVTWEVEADDDDPHYVRWDIFKEKLVCDCFFDSLVEGNCKHKTMVKEYIVNGRTEFET